MTVTALRKDVVGEPGTIQFREIGRPTVRAYFQYLPESVGEGAPVLVLIHGISRRAAQLVFRFRDQADKHGLVLVAPLFQKVIYGQYQQVIDKAGPRSDLALIDILEEVEREWHPAASPAHVFGYSGGAQFAHRFALLHPHRVASLSLAAAGWYTMPDGQRRYPWGIGTHPLGDKGYELDAFLRIDRHIFVGEDDVLRDASLRQSPRLDREQGINRVERAKRWIERMDQASMERDARPRRSTIDILPGLGHSFGRSARRKVDLPARVLSRLAIDLKRG